MEEDLADVQTRMKNRLSHYGAFDALPDGVAIFDRATGAILDVNERMCQMHGYAREEMIALEADDLCADITSDAPEPPQLVIQNTTADGPQTARWCNRRKDGTHFWTEVHLRHATLDDTACVVATLREANLSHVPSGTIGHDANRDNNPPLPNVYRHLQRVFHTLPVYVFRQDCDLRYTWLSGTVPGLNREELLGRRDADVLPEEATARLQPVKQRVLDTAEPACIEMQSTMDGQHRSFETHLVPERDETGTVTGLLGATIDVTERRTSERAQLESERRYRALFEVAQEGIVIQAPDGRILDANSAATEILGYRRTELLDMDWNAFLAETEQRTRVQERLQQHEAIRNLELRLRRKDGTKIACLVSAAAQRDADGTPRAYYTIFRDITERKRQEALFRHLVDEVKEYAIFMLDIDGHVLTWNEGAKTIKGYTKKEILGKHFSTFYTAEDIQADMPQKGMETATRTGQWKDEGWRVRKDGSRFWAHVTLTALHDEDGELRGFAKVTRDMTGRRQRERKLRRSEARYRRLFEESQEGIVISTPAGQIIDANPAAQRILGYSREELRTMKAQHVYVNPEVRARGVQILAEKGELRDFEVRARRKDGEIITCRLFATAWRSSDGAITAYQTFLHDVTGEKRALQALRDSEARFRTLAEKALVGIALLQEDPDRGIVYRYVNPAMAHLSGYAPEELVDESPAMLFHPVDWPYVRDTLRKRMEGTTQEAHYEARLQTKTGHFRVVEVMGSRFMYQNRPSIIGTVLDITERRRLEKELLWIQEKERRRIGRELHDGVASELTGAGTLTSVVANKAKQGTPIAPEEIDQIGTLIRTSTREIRRLARGLSPAELEAGLIPALKGLVHRTGAQHTLTCSFEAVGTVSRLPKETAVHLYRIAQEAIQNALKHAEAQHIRVRYGLETDELLTLDIRDDGRGGAQQALHAGGSGLGLPTMRYRANLIGATLTVENAPEGGTIIRCQIPVSRLQPNPPGE